MMLLVLILLIINVFQLTDAIDPIVQTKYGPVRGIRAKESLQYLGIPYARPPVGPLRWANPQEHPPWGSHTYIATLRKPACPQKACTKILPDRNCPQNMDEDCLYLNIWTPLNASSTTAYPVMVFIHGGAFQWGSGAEAKYDGSYIASKGEVILVNMDYRLGLLGFLYTGDGDTDAHGNYGIRDQRRALLWVQDNIANFGGDPKKVTLFGESCGAQSTFIHLTSPESDGLFRAVIIESSPFALPYRTKKEALLLTEKVRKLIECPMTNIASCMRGKTVAEILEVEQEIALKLTAGKFEEYFEPVGPIIDGDVIPLQPMMAAVLGKFRKIPIILGTNTDEAILFVYGELKVNLTLTEYEVVLALLHPSNVRKIEEFYAPRRTFSDYRQNISQVITDFLFTCSNRNVTRAIVKNDVSNVYLYLFDHATTKPGNWGKDSFCEDHVCHGEELDYIFNNPVVNYSLDEDRLASSLLKYWTNFAHSLDPNIGPHAIDLKWSKYDVITTQSMHFRTPANEIIRGYRSKYCDFWDLIGF